TPAVLVRARQVRARRSLLRHREGQRAGASGQPQLLVRGLAEGRLTCGAGAGLVERARGNGAGPSHRLEEGGSLLPRQPPPGPARSRSTAALLPRVPDMGVERRTEPAARAGS